MNEREAFEAWWQIEMNVQIMDLHRRNFPMTPDHEQPYACHETQRSWLTWQASRRAALEEAKQLCLGREARVDPVTKGDCEWFTGFSEGIKTGARHCACEIDEAIRALAASDKEGT